MTFLAHLTIWTYLELFAYVWIYKICFSVLRNHFDNWFFMAKWSIGRGTALALANLIISGLFGLGASLSGFTILYLRLNNNNSNSKSETSSETKDALPEKSLACELGIREDLVTRAMLASIAYFIYDLWAMFTVHTMREKERRGEAFSEEKETNAMVRYRKEILSFLMGRPLMIVHHIAMAFVFIPMILVRRDHEPGDILISCTFLLETSTPFVALRTILSDLHCNKSILYVINGIFMLVVFFICRILIYPFFYYVYGLWVGVGFFQALLKTPWYCALGLVISFLPQVYWFKLMFKGAIKMVKSQSHINPIMPAMPAMMPINPKKSD